MGTGISGFVPLAHGVYVFGWSQMRAQSGMPYYLAEGAFLCLGALVYSVSLFCVVETKSGGPHTGTLIFSGRMNIPTVFANLTHTAADSRVNETRHL